MALRIARSEMGGSVLGRLTLSSSSSLRYSLNISLSLQNSRATVDDREIQHLAKSARTHIIDV